MMKLGLSYFFCEDINKLCVSGNVGRNNLMGLDFITNKMTVDFNVFDSFVENKIGGDMKGSLVIVVKWSRLELRDPKITEKIV